MPLARGLLTAVFVFLFAAFNAFASTPDTLDLEDYLEKVEEQLVIYPDDLQLIFVRGMLMAEMGRPLKAADSFRNMLARDPDLLRPRLELGRVLMQAGEYYGARYNFEQTLKHELPDTVRQNVMLMLARIREELPSFSLATELIFDSNPKQATSSKEVEIDGLIFKLDDDARADSETGLRLLFDGRIPFGDPKRWFTRAHVEHQEFSGRDLDFSYFQLAGGRHFPREKHTLTLEGGYHRSYYRHRLLYHGIIWSVSDFRALREDMFLNLNLTGMQLDYSDYSYRDSWQHTASATAIYVASPVSRWDAGLGYTINRAEESAYSFDQPFVHLRYAREWPGGWITGANFRASRIQYEAPDPFFRETRIESEIRVEADVLNRRIRLWRFSPRLLIGYVDYKSNIDFFSWQRNYVRVGMTAEF